ncbi:hypothetical protein [Streptomyces sp. NPDC059009]|uniref:hypothetical protein n=1 Tax=Streptomyces sp. NPDC059009 TaxID=3346694 RepID=UPI00367CC23F
MSTPLVTIALASDGRSWVDGTEVQATEGGLDQARAAAMGHVAQIARQRRGPVRVEATDPDGAVWRVVVDPERGILEPGEARELPDDPDANAVAAAYAQGVAAVNQALADGLELVATRRACELEAEAIAQHGSDHPYVWRTRELRAHTAYRVGMAGMACELYLEAARGWRELGSDAYWGAIQRAYAMWHHTQDEEGRTVWLGEQLVDELRLGASRAGGGKSAGTLRAVLRRIDELRMEGFVI